MHPLIGHTEAQAQLADMLASGRLPHALLLYGPQGIGKRLLATHLAYRLMCGPKADEGPSMFGPAEAPPLAYDDQSPIFHQLAAGSSPDFHVLEPEEGKKSIGVKQARSLLSSLLRSTDNQRVVIVDALEQLTEESANALLKTLEEPRPNLTFLLVCHQLSATLPTIRSRCRLMRIHPLSEAETRKVLRAQGGDDDLAPTARGCPGQVMGEPARLLQDMMKHVAPALEDQPVKPASASQAPHVPEALMALLAQTKTLAHAQAYARIQGLKGKAKALNLPANLVAEVVVGMVKG